MPQKSKGKVSDFIRQKLSEDPWYRFSPEEIEKINSEITENRKKITPAESKLERDERNPKAPRRMPKPATDKEGKRKQALATAKNLVGMHKQAPHVMQDVMRENRKKMFEEEYREQQKKNKKK